MGAALLVAALALRIGNLEDALLPGGLAVPPFDDLYHLKRIVHSAAHFPAVLERDPLRGTDAAFCPWPPLYDLAAGGLVRLLGARTPAEATARAIWIPPLVGAAGALLAALAVSRRLGATAGLLAGLALALSPALVHESRLGSLDHHYVEPFLALLLVWATALLSGEGREDDGRDAGRRGARNALAFGAALSFALLMQTAFLFMAALAAAAVLLAPGGPGSGKRLRSAAAGFLLGAAVLAVFRMTRPAGYPEGQWFLGTPHAAALLGAAVACGAAAWLTARGSGWLPSRAAGVVLGGLVIVAVPGSAAAFLDGARYFGGDPWLGTIEECRPLLGGHRGLRSALELAGGGALLALPAAALAFRRRSFPRRVLAVFAVGTLVAVLARERFLVFAIPVLALAGAAATADLLAAERRLLAAAAAAATVGPFVLASLGPPDASPALPPWTRPVVRAALSIQGAAPKEGRVLAPWVWGHLFDVLGGRGVLIDGFGTMPGRSGFEEAQAALLENREERLVEFCRRTGVRFVAFDNPVFRLPESARGIGLPREAFLREGPAPGAAPSVTRYTQSTLWWRAYFHGGKEDPRAGPWGRPFRFLRLVYQDPEPSWEPAPYSGPAIQVWRVDLPD